MRCCRRSQAGELWQELPSEQYGHFQAAWRELHAQGERTIIQINVEGRRETPYEQRAWLMKHIAEQQDLMSEQDKRIYKEINHEQHRPGHQRPYLRGRGMDQENERPDAAPDAPCLITLDEAFAGVDEQNMRDMFCLVEAMGFNYIMNSQAIWGDCDVVPELNIYELLRPLNANYVTLYGTHWNGERRELLVPEEQRNDAGA